MPIIHFCIRPHYDSGWFDVSVDTTYTLTHNFGKHPCNIVVLYRENETYTNFAYMEYQYDPSGKSNGANWAANENEIIIHTAPHAINPIFAAQLGAGSGNVTNGQFRVLAWK